MITLIPSQMPQQDLGMIAQALMAQGFVQQPASERKKGSYDIIFYTENKSDIVTMRFYQDIGTLRVETEGALANKLVMAIAQYMEGLNAKSVEDLFDAAHSDMERRVYAILLVLAYDNAANAMSALHEKYITNGSDATREGIVQGLAFLETPDVGQALEALEAEFKGQPLATLCRRGIDSLSERGLIRESLGSFVAKISALIEEDASEAISQIDKYCEDNPDAAALRAYKARALIKLGKIDEATELLSIINLNDPDAPEAFIERAKIREAQKFIDQAIRDIRCAMACDPTSQEAQTIYARLALISNQKESSDEEKLEEFTKALEDNPDDANLLCQRAECLLRVGENELARKDALHARKVAPNDQRVPMILCEALLNLGLLGSALEQASIAQKVFMPAQQVEAALLKVRVFMAINRIPSARHALRELAPEVQSTAAAKLYTAIIDELEGNVDEAKAGYAALSPSIIDEILRTMPPVLYVSLPELASVAGNAVPSPREPYTNTLGNEPADPYFKRCDQCGALTMARRTYCKECGAATFFE